jgi:hypothetical protein
MTRGVRKYLVGSVVLVALIAVAGCSHYLLAERAPWRHDAEVACMDSGVAEEIPGRVRISAIQGPGACGIDYPLKVSELGEARPLGYDDEPLVPPGSIPNASMPQWPVVQSRPLPPPQYNPQATPRYAPPPYPPQPYNPQPYGSRPYSSQPYGPPPAVPAQAGAPLSLAPPGSVPAASEPYSGGAPHPYYNAPDDNAPAPRSPAATRADVPDFLYSPRPMMPPPGSEHASPETAPIPPLGPPAPPPQTAGPVEVSPPATLACPIVSALDKWVAGVVQPSALRWFGQPVVEIKQIGSYSCRGMVNGNPNAPISEHAFGNAIDIAEFDLADGHRISVQYGWHGTPEEQGFLHDVQGGACRDFTTVLAPGANVYHYNHIHVDLMRRAYRPYICEPTAIPGAVAAARARALYVARHLGVTGSISSKRAPPDALGYSADDDHLPEAVPGDD